MEGAGASAGVGGCTFEDGLEIVIVILIKPTESDRFLRVLQSTFYVAVFRAGVGLDRKAAVAPQLPFSTEPVRSLNQRDQQSGPNRTDVGNLTQQFRRTMFPALGKETPPHLLAQSLQRVELLVEMLGSTAYACFGNPAQPF